MALEIEVLSKQNIKPSVPTPEHLKNYTLSFLDQVAPGIFIPLILYYTSDDQANHSLKSDHLKKSLSEALTKFYPLAGRFVENGHVECNDEGAQFVEANVNCNLKDVIRDPIPNELNKLLPLELDDANADLNFAVQVTFFKCGGIAIGAVIYHKLADGLSFVNFMNSWAAIARGEQNVPSPILDLATLFPPQDISGFDDRTRVKTENIVCKRFQFDASNIAAIKNKCAEDNKNKGTEDPTQPTRVEALSAFMWNRYMAATRKNTGVPGINIMLLPVNLRTRFDPPLPKDYFGNLYRMAIFTPSMQNGERDDYGDLINKAREAIRGVDTNYVEKLRKGEDHLMYMKQMCQKSDLGEIVTMSFTSLSRFGVYDVNFGWGNPVWIGSARLTFSNVITFFDNKEGDGIEAWINLKEDEMAQFEADQELLSFVSSPV
ncbi:Vinorine synthase [Heracleum sosnowskyi]|uniref:Vinorine synthase n=1 Tax=Heracleum sosnowskyi TaxID=360622 RepID=A0AAD8MDQ6_9APIA|nr:Vinorine synthase [Heracleum sosnowskyi]